MSGQAAMSPLHLRINSYFILEKIYDEQKITPQRRVTGSTRFACSGGMGIALPVQKTDGDFSGVHKTDTLLN